MSESLQMPVEVAYRRRSLFALEVLDGVTLERITTGLTVLGEGLRRIPAVNASGLFVWGDEDIGQLRKVIIDPLAMPLEGVEVPAAQIQPGQIHTVLLSPTSGYRFTTGVTALIGTLIEQQVVPPLIRVPVRDAAVHLQWLDEDHQWHDASTISHTEPTSGDFAAIARFSALEVPLVNSDGTITVRLRARRGTIDRGSAALRLLLGQVTEPSRSRPLTFAWEDLQ